MGDNNAVKKKYLEKLADDLCKKVHFSRDEVKRHARHFMSLLSTSSQNYHNLRMDRTKFREVLQNDFKMTDDVLMDRVYRAFDTDSDGVVSIEEWIVGFSVFLKGTLQEHKKFCFMVFDLNQDGVISRDEMFQLLKNSLVKQPTEEDPDEGIKELVEIALKKMDVDHDGRVSFSDFNTSVDEERLLLEVCGSCLPRREDIVAYEAKLAELDLHR